MSRSRREQLLRAVLVLYGILAVCLYPLMLLWPGGWRWMPYDSSYEHMLIAVYATLGVCLLLAVARPERHRSLVLFAGWSSLAHAGFMAVDAVRHTAEQSHLAGDIPLVALGGVLLLLLAPRPPEPRSA